MAKLKRRKKKHDFSIIAFRVVQEATGQKDADSEKAAGKKNFDAKALGHLGGLKGGPARANALTPERRREIAQKAARVRWGLKAR